MKEGINRNFFAAQIIFPRGEYYLSANPLLAHFNGFLNIRKLAQQLNYYSFYCLQTNNVLIGLHGFNHFKPFKLSGDFSPSMFNKNNLIIF